MLKAKAHAEKPDSPNARALLQPPIDGGDARRTGPPVALALWLGPTLAFATGLAATLCLLLLADECPAVPALVALTTTAGLLGGGLGLWIERSIGRPLRRLATGAHLPSAADLGPEVPREIALIHQRLTGVGTGASRTAFEPDRLTGLPEIRTFRLMAETALREALTAGRRVAVIVIDIDRLKDVNTFHGYATGDSVLVHVARRLVSACGARHRLTRIGGDRFAVLAVDVADAEDASSLAGQLLDRIGRPLSIDGFEITPAASAGVALYPDHGASIDQLLRANDMALDEAKRAGGQRCRLFEPRLDVTMQARRTMERELRSALAASEFKLFFQPQIDLRTGRVFGVEALLRWPRETGMVPPGAFIPVAESCGLIKALGAWVLSEACRTAKRWHDMGYRLSMAVNVSAAQLRQQDLVGVVSRVLDDTGLPPDALELELTESLFVDPNEVGIRRNINRIAEMGVRLAIDDFGTGYSSLAYLKRLPVDKIKIDKSFVDELGTDDADEAIVRTILSLARTFGKRVLAEGVEREAQRAFLAREGCDEAQGYLFSRPMPEEACLRHMPIWTAAPQAAPEREKPRIVTEMPRLRSA